MTPLQAAVLVVAATLSGWGILWASFWRRRETLKAKGTLAPATALPEASVRPGQPSARDHVPPARQRSEAARGVTRRQFLNRAYVAAILAGLSNVALASLDFLWPRGASGLGTKITVGDAEALRAQLDKTRTPIFNPEGFFWLMTYEGLPAAANQIAAYASANVVGSGFVAMHRRCVHLGCSVPWCDTSKWFECPCHGSKYSINGEYRSGPAPRSLDRFRVDIVGGKVVVDTSNVITGPPRGTTTSQPQPEGVHCVTLAWA